MAVFIYILSLAVVSATLSNIQAVKISKDSKENIAVNMFPFLVECNKGRKGISKEEIEKAHKTHKEYIDKCFFECLFQKSELLNENGKVNAEKLLATLQDWLLTEEDLKHAQHIADTCAAVNDVKVEDVDEGCERAVLLLRCLHDQIRSE